MAKKPARTRERKKKKEFLHPQRSSLFFHLNTLERKGREDLVFVVVVVVWWWWWYWWCERVDVLPL